MRYQGKDLSELMNSIYNLLQNKRGTRMIIHVLQAFSSLIEGLRLLHEHNYVHGDIKLENIMSSTDPHTNKPTLRFNDYDFFSTNVVQFRRKILQSTSRRLYFIRPPELYPSSEMMKSSKKKNSETTWQHYKIFSKNRDSFPPPIVP